MTSPRSSNGPAVRITTSTARGRCASFPRPDRRVVGVLQVISTTAEYTPGQLEVVDGLVGQMAAAVRNARLQKEQRRLEAAEAADRKSTRLKSSHTDKHRM